MIISRCKFHLFLLTCLATVSPLMVVCYAHSAKQAKKAHITQLELQSDLMVFADNFSVYLHPALREYKQAPECKK